MKEGSRKQGAVSPCAACKLLRRRCTQECLFAPYFPADEPQKFANVHKVFGASNVNKLLQVNFTNSLVILVATYNFPLEQCFRLQFLMFVLYDRIKFDWKMWWVLHVKMYLWEMLWISCIFLLPLGLDSFFPSKNIIHLEEPFSNSFESTH